MGRATRRRGFGHSLSFSWSCFCAASDPGNPLDESDCKMSDAVADPFLVSLGFEEKDCIEAIIQTNGNVSEAAVWLTDNRDLGGQQEQTADVAASTQSSLSVSNSSTDGQKTTSVDQTSAQRTAA